MISLIDGDSIAFILGWHHREHQHVPTIHEAVDKFLDDIFTLTGADMYFGALKGEEKCFRYHTYKVKPYKGKRKELSEIMQFWQPIINDYLKTKWGFQTPGTLPLEADDMIYTASKCLEYAHTICSPDKDLRQIPGNHFDYKTGEFLTVDEHQARYNFFRLMIEGDDTDNIAGIPGAGEKKAKEKLDPLLAGMATGVEYDEVVRALYHKQFCQYYGDIIYEETFEAISLRYSSSLQINVLNVPVKEHPFDELTGN